MEVIKLGAKVGNFSSDLRVPKFQFKGEASNKQGWVLYPDQNQVSQASMSEVELERCQIINKLKNDVDNAI